MLIKEKYDENFVFQKIIDDKLYIEIIILSFEII